LADRKVSPDGVSYGGLEERRDACKLVSESGKEYGGVAASFSTRKEETSTKHFLALSEFGDGPSYRRFPNASNSIQPKDW